MAQHAGLVHRVWCDRQHAPEWLACTAQVGADLQLTRELSYAVMLYAQGSEPAEVHLLRHASDEASVTKLSIVETGIFRDLFGEALGLLAREAGL